MSEAQQRRWQALVDARAPEIRGDPCGADGAFRRTLERRIRWLLSMQRKLEEHYEESLMRAHLLDRQLGVYLTAALAWEKLATDALTTPECPHLRLGCSVFQLGDIYSAEALRTIETASTIVQLYQRYNERGRMIIDAATRLNPRRHPPLKEALPELRQTNRVLPPLDATAVERELSWQHNYQSLRRRRTHSLNVKVSPRGERGALLCRVAPRSRAKDPPCLPRA